MLHKQCKNQKYLEESFDATLEPVSYKKHTGPLQEPSSVLSIACQFSLFLFYVPEIDKEQNSIQRKNTNGKHHESCHGFLFHVAQVGVEPTLCSF